MTAPGTTTGLPGAAAMLSWLTAGPLTEPAGTTPGYLGWNFSAVDSAFDYLSAGQSVTLAYTVQVSDNQGAAASQIVSVTVNGVNYKPSAVGQSGFTTDNWTPITIQAASLLTGASDPNTADTLSVAAVGGGVGGSAALVNGNGVFTPTATAIGLASFTYTVADNHGGTATATVNLTTTLHTIVGTAGGTIVGGTKPAELDGSAGNEVVKAGAAGDLLVGAAGDSLYGGGGADSFAFHAGFGRETLYSFAATGLAHDVVQIDKSPVRRLGASAGSD